MVIKHLFRFYLVKETVLRYRESNMNELGLILRFLGGKTEYTYLIKAIFGIKG